MAEGSSETQPTYAKKLEYWDDNLSLEGFFDNKLASAAVAGAVSLMILGDVLSKPRDVLLFLKEACKDPRGFLHDYKESTKAPEVKEKLHMQTYGHQDVIDLFKGKAPEPDPDPNSTPRRKLMIGLGGGQAGNIGAGTFRGMQQAGAYQRADGLCLISAANPNAMYTETDQNEEGVEVYQKDNTEPNFFVKLPKDTREAVAKLIQLLRKGPEDPIVDTTTVADGMRRRRPLNVEKLRASPRELIAVLTDAKTGKPRYVDLRTAEDPIAVMDASICIPALSSVPSVRLEDGRDYVDGGVSDAIPLEWAFEQGYTDILIVANSPIISSSGLIESTVISLILERLAKNPNYKYSPPLTKALKGYLSNRAKAAANVNKIIKENHPNRRVAVIEPYDEAFSGMFETNRDRLVIAYNDAKEFARQTFAQI